MLRFLADADLHFGIVGGCRRREPSIDFLSANQANLAGVPDPEVLRTAAEQGRILVTHDGKTMPYHFGDYLVAHGSHPGVLVVSQASPIGSVVDELLLIWAASEAGEWANRIVRIQPGM